MAQANEEWQYWADHPGDELTDDEDEDTMEVVHNFHQMDEVQAVLKALDAKIEEFRGKSFHNFSIFVNVTPSPKVAHLQQQNLDVRSYDMYEFEYFGKDPVAMPVRKNSNNNDELEVFYARKWCRVEDYLAKFKPQVDWNANCFRPREQATLAARKVLWQQQLRWWFHNGKKFRINDLPKEVRQLIYSYTIGPYIDVDKLHKNGTMDPEDRIHYWGLLLCNKQVNVEVSHILFELTPFRIERHVSLNRLLKYPFRYSRIRKLELVLNHQDYLRAFGFRSFQGVVYKGIKYIENLKFLTLTDLVLDFEPPTTSAKVTWLDKACQKVVVEWILLASIPYILHHNPRFSGYIKISTLQAWNQLVAEEPLKKKLWEKWKLAVNYNEQMQNRKVLNGQGVWLEQALHEQSLTCYSAKELAYSTAQVDLISMIGMINFEHHFNACIEMLDQDLEGVMTAPMDLLWQDMW